MTYRDQRFTPAMAQDAFEEGKHPRDHGKFSSGSRAGAAEQSDVPIKNPAASSDKKTAALLKKIERSGQLEDQREYGPEDLARRHGLEAREAKSLHSAIQAKFVHNPTRKTVPGGKKDPFQLSPGHGTRAPNAMHTGLIQAGYEHVGHLKNGYLHHHKYAHPDHPNKRMTVTTNDRGKVVNHGWTEK